MNDKRNEKDKIDVTNFQVEREDGLQIQYDKEHLEEQYPNLMEEIVNKKQVLNIDSICISEENDKIKSFESNNRPEELINPGVMDFLRRCKKNEEAIEILDFLLHRNEITSEDYDSYKSQIKKENGLKELIEAHGGLKKPGYYERKYYKNPKFESYGNNKEINNN
ncbi:MAG: DUF2095 family protein [Candidatus Lokiarchaeota archaeon]|nr:DUF2095 family protein [Candidatus Lokiarchaeota archaeon]